MLQAIDVAARGAVGDGKTLNTRVLQEALDAAGAPGGPGHVVIPAGIFVTGTLHLRSRLWLELRPGAVLQGSEHLGDYEELGGGFQKDLQPYHLLVAHGTEQVRISGPGRIDGRGPAFWEPQPLPSGWFREQARRPSPLIECADCRGLVWDGVEIANSPGWTLHLKRCDDVVIRGVSIRNDLFGPNTDGIDIDGCRDVRISDCLIEAGDDAIVLKTTPVSRSCERVVVTNCSIATNCRALKLGSRESYHDMRDVVFSNCVVRRSVAVFGLYCRNGATLENIAVSNIVGHAFSNADWNQPIHIDLGRWDAAAKPGRIRNVTVDNMICHSNGRILVNGEEGNPVEHITLRGIQLHVRDPHDPAPGGRAAKGHQFSPAAPEARAARAALVVQHARGFHADGVRVIWPEHMPAPFHGLWARDVQGGSVDMDGLAASGGGLTDADVAGCALQLR